MAAQRGRLPRVVKLFVLPVLLLFVASFVLYVFSDTPSGESVLRLIPIIIKPHATGYDHIETDLPALHPAGPASTPSATTSADRHGSSVPNTATSTTAVSPPKYKPSPTWTPPPQIDTFPLLSQSDGPPPPIPARNVPRPKLHADYNLTNAPPLFIGFTRQWPILLQAVVSYITAGWPPESIVVVENTGRFDANTRGKLSLQNPFYLNHTTLHRLGVEILQTPVLLSFAQLQNFFLATARARGAPYYLYSHQDVLVFSMEDGADDRHRPSDREWAFYDEADRQETMNPPPAGQPGYLTIYERAVRELHRTLETDERWAFRWFQYDHLALVNAAAVEAVGGWDSLIPYYLSDCDINNRLRMEGWSMIHRRAGLINDVASTLEDLAALYRVPGVIPRFVDPNPSPPEPPARVVTTPPPLPENTAQGGEEVHRPGAKANATQHLAAHVPRSAARNATSASGGYFRALADVGLSMSEHKHGGRGRNTWQASQHGGFGEPYYYDAAGFVQALDIITEAGREVYRQKWGQKECDWPDGTSLKLWDQWKVLPSWEEE